MLTRLVFSASTLFVCLTWLGAADSWPQFRGPTGDGHAPNARVPVKFDARDGVAWRTDIPGKAWSSPVVADDMVWVTAAVERRPTEAELKQILEEQIENPRHRSSRNVAKAIELKLIGVDLSSGSIRHTIDLDTIEAPEAIHTLNSYASPTPIIDGDRIYCHFGTYGTFSIDLKSLDTVWQRRFPLVHSVGPGSSPLVYDGVLVLIQDGVSGNMSWD